VRDGEDAVVACVLVVSVRTSIMGIFEFFDLELDYRSCYYHTCVERGTVLIPLAFRGKSVEGNSLGTVFARELAAQNGM